jgi:hypothetical protein
MLYGCAPSQPPTTAAPIAPATSPAPAVDVLESSEPPADEVALTLVPIDRHRGRLSIRARITNNLDQPIVIDRDFSVNFDWSLRTDGGGGLRPAQTHSLEPTAVLQDKSRFVTLAPAETLSHDFELSKPIRHFVYGEGAVFSPDGETGYIPTGYEEECQYEIPESTRELKISLNYGPQWFHVDGFPVWFGYAAQDVNLWNGHCSTSIQVTLE